MKPIPCHFPLLLVVAAAACCFHASNLSAQDNSDHESKARTYDLALDMGHGVTMEFVLIRPGVFMMGSDEGGSAQQPVHKVRITQPFYLGKYEVTQEQWEKVMRINRSTFKGAKLPVEQVNWHDCQDFLAKLNAKADRHEFHLPTEAQWEYACRAGSTGDSSGGNGPGNLEERAWYSRNSDSRTHAVGNKKPNAWGLYDMQGNVWEWCSDAWGPYPGGEVSDPAGASSGHRVLRGGAWLSSASDLRPAGRNNCDPAIRYSSVGFRCVVLVKPSGQ